MSFVPLTYSAPVSRANTSPSMASRDSLARANNAGGLWRIGQSVTHAKFGEGMIVNIESSGADARVQVNFRKTGTKWLALEYAKLAAL